MTYAPSLSSTLKMTKTVKKPENAMGAQAGKAGTGARAANQRGRGRCPGSPGHSPSGQSCSLVQHPTCLGRRCFSTPRAGQ